MGKEYIILEEEEVEKLLTIPLAISVIARCFEEKSKGLFSALAKINIKGTNGDLRITPGESSSEFNAIGFRLYDVIRNDFSSQPQLTVVYDNESGRLKGIVISQLLGAYRTAAINAVMQKRFHPTNINELGIVGTGYQARIHLEAFVHTLQPKKVLIYGRTKSNLDQFIIEMQYKLGQGIELVPCQQISQLNKVDALLLVTRSTSNLLALENFKNPMVITTVGPKKKNRSELSNAFADTCDLIITDSKEQVEKYGEQFFIDDISKIHDFSDYIKTEQTAPSKEQRILLCSVGMGGTEIALANELIQKKINLL